MKVRLLMALLATVMCTDAQAKLSVRQLVAFVESSLKLRHEDNKLAAYLKSVSLREQLDDRTIESLQGAGIGPKTLEVLRALRDTSKNLPAPAPLEPKQVPPTIPPPSLADQKRILGELREYALSYTKRLPDFICTQVTRRYVDPSGLEFWQRQDVITTRLSFFEQKEDYKVVLVNSRPVEVDYHKLGGAISAGEFGTMLKEVFEPQSRAEFEWMRWATLRGRRHHVYSYRVPKATSKWRITYQNSLDIVPGYKGSIYVDAENTTISRIRLEAEGIPPSFPVQQAVIELDYDAVPIGGGNYMLPLKHTMRMREGKVLVKNEVEFRMYRKFGTETTITFEPEPLPEEKLQEQPPN
jgi:hypothetical protein